MAASIPGEMEATDSDRAQRDGNNGAQEPGGKKGEKDLSVEETRPISPKKLPKAEEQEQEKTEQGESLKISSAAASREAEKESRINEDNYIDDKEGRVFGTLDGIGGHAAGEVASRIAKEIISEKLGWLPLEIRSKQMGDMRKEFGFAFKRAHETIVEQAEEHDKPIKPSFAKLKKEESDAREKLQRLRDERAQGRVGDAEVERQYKIWKAIEAEKKEMKDQLWEGMGTTAIAGKIFKTEEGPRLLVGSIGDSRAYLLRDGKIFQLTEDETKVQRERKMRGYLKESENFEIRGGELIEGEPLGGGYKPDEAFKRWMGRERHKIDRNLGLEDEERPYREPQFVDLRLKDGDIVLFVTDGLPDNLDWDDPEEIRRVVEENRKTGLAAERLVERAREEARAGLFHSHRDDMTAVVVEIG